MNTSKSTTIASWFLSKRHELYKWWNEIRRYWQENYYIVFQLYWEFSLYENEERSRIFLEKISWHQMRSDEIETTTRNSNVKFRIQSRSQSCKLHFAITSCASDRFTLFLQLWKVLNKFYNMMSLRHYNMCDNCVARNAAIARAQYIANDIRFEMSSIQVWRQLRQMQTLFSNNFMRIWSIYVISAVMKSSKWTL